MKRYRCEQCGGSGTVPDFNCVCKSRKGPPAQPVQHVRREPPKRLPREVIKDRLTTCKTCLWCIGGQNCFKFRCHRRWEQHVFVNQWPETGCKMYVDQEAACSLESSSL